MQIPVLSAVALLSLLALHTAQGAALGEDTTLGTYAAEPELKGMRSATPDSQ
uniref:Keratinocyte differentiation associated protein n=1 Tax=Jaculus jaculus TaxID=51337 RepID=A0A8C5LJT4_JACJA